MLVQIILIFISCLLPCSLVLADQEYLCSNLSLEGDHIPSFNSTEKKLLCGDQSTDAWRVIPQNQRIYFLRNFLQDRGFFFPKFQIQSDQLMVQVGQVTEVKFLFGEGLEELKGELNLNEKRKVIGETLTPSLLDQLEQWVESKLRSKGYPCPQVSSEANPDTGVIVIKVKSGPRQNLTKISVDQYSNIQPGVFRRFDAFTIGHQYQGDLMRLTSNRLLSSKILEGNHFLVTCGEKGAEAKQEVIMGPPRLISFGFGGNTEGLFLIKASFQNARYGSNSNNLNIYSYLSTKEQTIYGYLDYYYSYNLEKTFLRPGFEMKHQNEESFEVISTSAHLYHVIQKDNDFSRFQASFGPVLDGVRTLKGAEGQRNSSFLSLNLRLDITTHLYEIYQDSPRTGLTSYLSIELNHEGLLSTTTAQKFDFWLKKLWNFKNYDPPLWIFGVKSGVSNLLTHELPGASSRVPANYYLFLGGGSDLRGFGRKELPMNGHGALSTFFVDLEWRWAETIGWSLEPLILWDFGMLGMKPWSFSQPIYYSPGFGLRFASSLGVFRTTFAKGFTSQGSSHLQFYLSYGEEF